MTSLMYLGVVWLHVLGAAIWVGGLAFFVVVLVPLARQGQASTAWLVEQVGYRFRTVGWITLLMLLGTGLTMLHYRGTTMGSALDGSAWQGGFGRILSIKISLVLVMLAVSALHDFYVGPRATRLWHQTPDAPAAQRWRRSARVLGRLNALLALLIVAAAVCLARDPGGL